MSLLTPLVNEIEPRVVALIEIVAMWIVSLCGIENIGSSLSFGIVLNSMFESYTCVPVWHLEPEIQLWMSLIADGLYLDRYI